MPELQVFHLRPTGWESDPPDEFFRLSTADYFVGQVYTPFTVFFKLPDIDNDDAAKQRIVSALKHALELTLSQCRQLCGVLEPHPDNSDELCFHKTRDSTVEFHVQHLDRPEDNDAYPSFAYLEAHHFTSASLGSLHTWTVAPMTFGPKPEAEPHRNPKASSFKASFIPGGMVLVMAQHHYANDAHGWAGSMHQLAENCAAIWTQSKPDAFPPWDPAYLDKSRLTAPDVPAAQRVDAAVPSPPRRHPEHRSAQKNLLFHLSARKAAELKRLASPAAGDEGRWISSYDAFMALTWRVLTRHRARLFGTDPEAKTPWGETVNMRTRLDLPVPGRAQGNWVWAAVSSFCKDAVPELTVGDVVSGVPLAELAWYIRRLTNTVTQAALTAGLTTFGPVRNKAALSYRADSLPPLSIMISDWRGMRACRADFGFGKPVAFRMLADVVVPGMVAVYGEGEGVEVCVAVEREIVGDLLGDEEWARFFEFGGVEGEDELK